MMKRTLSQSGRSLVLRIPREIERELALKSGDKVGIWISLEKLDETHYKQIMKIMPLSNMRRCLTCGNYNPIDSNVCRFCGKNPGIIV